MEVAVRNKRVEKRQLFVAGGPIPCILYEVSSPGLNFEMPLENCKISPLNPGGSV